MAQLLATGLIVGQWPHRAEWPGIALELFGVLLLTFDGDIRANPQSVLIQATALCCWAIRGRRL
jgi:drug/metabolite transporter (DMT)-like permease